MKLFVSILFMTIILSCKSKNDNGRIHAKQLLEIIIDSSLPAFKKVVKDNNYLPIDSSVIEKGEMMYGAEGSGEKTADFASVKTSSDHYVNYLQFTTYRKDLYNKLKEEFIMNHDFVISNPEQGLGEYVSGKIQLTVMTNEEKEGVSYDFFLVRRGQASRAR